MKQLFDFNKVTLKLKTLLLETFLKCKVFTKSFNSKFPNIGSLKIDLKKVSLF